MSEQLSVLAVSVGLQRVAERLKLGFGSRPAVSAMLG